MEIQKINSANTFMPAKIKDNGDTVSITVPKKTAKAAAMLASSMLSLAAMAQADIKISKTEDNKTYIKESNENQKSEQNEKSDDFYKSLATLALLLAVPYGAATIANKKDLHIIPKHDDK